MSVNQREYCVKCEKSFDDIMVYNLHLISTKIHVAGSHCYRDFFTEEARRIHVRQEHPKEQSINCPGCGEHFIRISSLVFHIENHHCLVLGKDALKTYRNVPKVLAALDDAEIMGHGKARVEAHSHAAAITRTQELNVVYASQDPNNLKETEGDDHMSTWLFDDDDEDTQRMLMARNPWGSCDNDEGMHSMFNKPLEIPAEPKPTGEEEWIATAGEDWTAKMLQPPSFGVFGDYMTEAPEIVPQSTIDEHPEFPKLPTAVKVGNRELKRPGSQTTEHVQNGSSPWTKSSPWSKSSAIAPGIPAVKPSSAVLEEIYERAPPKATYSENDPDSPDFNVMIYYNKFNQKYTCPWAPRCKTLLKTPHALKTHIKSGIHINERLRCPSCLREFATASSLVAHGESQAIRCNIRDTLQFHRALKIATGGVVEVTGLHKDDTVKYSTGKIGQQSLINEDIALWAKEQQEAKAAREEQIRNFAW